MTYPALQLTNYESTQINKYADPRTGKRGVLRRFYGGFLQLTDNIRLPVQPFQIARRCRVFGLTFSGDTDKFLIDIIDVTGEKHTADPVLLNMLAPGNQGVPWSSFTAPQDSGNRLVFFPYLMEPNIVLAPNQTLQVRGYETQAANNTSYRVDIVFHVWEFPGLDGSPQ